MIDSNIATARPTRLPAGALPLPELPSFETVISRETIDQALAELQATKHVWARLDIAAKITILGELQRDLLRQGQRWVTASLQ